MGTNTVDVPIIFELRSLQLADIWVVLDHQQYYLVRLHRWHHRELLTLNRLAGLGTLRQLDPTSAAAVWANLQP